MSWALTIAAGEAASPSEPAGHVDQPIHAVGLGLSGYDHRSRLRSRHTRLARKARKPRETGPGVVSLEIDQRMLDGRFGVSLPNPDCDEPFHAIGITRKAGAGSGVPVQTHRRGDRAQSAEFS